MQRRTRQSDAGTPAVQLVKKSFRHFGHQLGPFWKILLLGWFCMVAVALLQLIKPWPVKMVFDGLLVPAGDLWVYRYWPALQARPDLFLAVAALSVLAVAASACWRRFEPSFTRTCSVCRTRSMT